MTTFTEYLAQYNESDWLAAIDELLPCIDEVDRNAVQIWFRFYPLGLQRYAAAAEDRAELLRGLALKGDFELNDQIDTSHHFLYGHRFWTKTKCVIERTADEYKGEETPLIEMIRSVAIAVAEKLKVDRSLTNAIAAVGLMTLNQVGLDAFKGPVPIECTSASCGTCWVGVLGGQEKLTEVKPRERRAMQIFGYNQPDEPRPFLRLACQARAEGNVTIVIPPWNGVFGKKVYGNVEDVELEPNTTSAKRLREVIKSAASGE
jgi:ferredoxin